MNRLIIFSNLKGGVGKSTLCALFSNYLAEQGETVMVIDADLQQSLIGHWKEDVEGSICGMSMSMPWNVDAIDDFGNLQETMPRLHGVDGWIIIDTPGTLNDDNLLYVFREADFAIVPFHYDSDSIRSTELFARTLSKVSNARMLFVPNRINGMEDRRITSTYEETAATILGKYGTIVSPIRRTVDVQRYNTVIGLTSRQMKAVGTCFGEIVDIIKS